MENKNSARADIIAATMANQIYCFHVYRELMKDWDPEAKLLAWQSPIIPLHTSLWYQNGGAEYWILWLLDTMLGGWLEGIGDVPPERFTQSERSDIIRMSIVNDRNRVIISKDIDVASILESLAALADLIASIDDNKEARLESYLNSLDGILALAGVDSYPRDDKWLGRLIIIMLAYLKRRFADEQSRFRDPQRFVALFGAEKAFDIVSKVTEFLQAGENFLDTLMDDLKKSKRRSAQLVSLYIENEKDCSNCLTEEVLRLIPIAITLAFLSYIFVLLPMDYVGALQERIITYVNNLGLQSQEE